MSAQRRAEHLTSWAGTVAAGKGPDSSSDIPQYLHSCTNDFSSVSPRFHDRFSLLHGDRGMSIVMTVTVSMTIRVHNLGERTGSL